MAILSEWKRFAFAGIFAGIGFLQAQELPTIKEDLTVKGSKNEISLEETTTHTVVVTREEMDTYHWRSVGEVLANLPGVSLVANGGDGKLTTVFLRGAKSENTLVLLDGIKLNDPTNVGKGFDFGNLSTSGIERIELILGPQSTLYGTDASAGIINIVSADGKGAPLTEFQAELSNEDTTRAMLSHSDQLGAVNYAVTAGYYDSDSISARADLLENGADPETDRYENLQITAKLGVRVNEKLQADIHLASANNKNDIDTFDGDDINYRSTYDQNSIGAVLGGKWFHDSLNHTLHLGWSSIDREAVDEVDERHPQDSSNANYDGTTLMFEFRNQWTVNEQVSLVFGVSHEEEQAEVATVFNSAFGLSESTIDEETDTASAFAQLNFSDASGFYGNLAARHDDHSLFGGESTWDLGLGYRFPTETRLRAAVGTGFKAPSIYQLYAPGFGNADLASETSDAFEIGVQQNLLDDRLQMGLSYFQYEFENMVEFVFDSVTFQSSYVNLSQAESDGYELWLGYTDKQLSVHVAYEDLDAEDTSGAEAVPLIRRHDDKATLRFAYRFNSPLRVSGDILRYGEAIDSNFSVGEVTLDAYTLVNLGISYELEKTWQFTVRATNLFDEEYTQVLNYGVNGRRVFAAVRARF
ncbi:TonB-dependent receptor plug domain-containing protein [Acanthopleuribacter pedis]|uniref:TonB-dependent receptor n=1 Tax=Acanthopleuribacter pedis TaxID=442870 RepID=A0A8J7Q9L1_9BACT|nr:TonB-dependent receptor [Acanthopleuribacter pedis]MBO1316916.1 TonB-dependent receptor [Acanthopleuribacter pedis]